MKNKIITSISNFFNKKTIIYTITLAIFIAIMLIPVDYYITIGGGIMNLDKDIKVTNEKQKKGTINATYVIELKGNVITYLLSYIIPSFEREKIKDVTYKKETKENYEFREKMYFNQSINNAIFVAYTNSNKKITTKSNDLYVIYIDEFATTNLKIRDKILEVDNIKINDASQIKEIISTKNENDYVEIKVQRKNSQIITKTKIKVIDNEKRIGVYILNDYNYDVEPKIIFDFSGKQSGPSGGLMLSLSIYNKLNNTDITKGNKICGTGTIDKEGVVGEIGGIKYKLQGAKRRKCDMFLVPKENYDEAYKIIKDKNYKIKLYKVETFNDALKILNNFL